MVGDTTRREFRKVVKEMLYAGYVIPAKPRKAGLVRNDGLGEL